MRVGIADDQCVGIAVTLSDICALTSALMFRPTCRLVLHASARYVRHGVGTSTRSVAESRGSRGLVSDVARKSRTCCEEMSSRDHLDMLRRSCELDKLVLSRVILNIFPKTRRDATGVTNQIGTCTLRHERQHAATDTV